MTSQKICMERLANCWFVPDSYLSQANASNDVSGSEATSAAIPAERFANSVTATMIAAEINTLMT